jgi:hypothetical protein
MRQAAYHYAQHLMPERGNFVEMHDAFELGTKCNKTRPSQKNTRDQWRASIDRVAAANGDGDVGATYYVSTTGADANAGTQMNPFASVARGVAACSPSTALPCTVVVAAGNYELGTTLHLGSANSNLHIRGVGAADGTWPVLSGGMGLPDLQWAPAGGRFPAGVVVADLPPAAHGLAFKQLFVDGFRAVRARHPNANPGGYYATGTCGVLAWVLLQSPSQLTIVIHPTSIARRSVGDTNWLV